MYFAADKFWHWGAGANDAASITSGVSRWVKKVQVSSGDVPGLGQWLESSPVH